MSKFRDTFDATRGDNEAARKHFDEVVKPRANAKVDRSFRERVRDVAATVATTPSRDDKWPWQ